MKKSTGLAYRKRLTRVIDYIYHHLDGDLSVNRLAEVAVMSPYHFHRIYRQLIGSLVNGCPKAMSSSPISRRLKSIATTRKPHLRTSC